MPAQDDLEAILKATAQESNATLKELEQAARANEASPDAYRTLHRGRDELGREIEESRPNEAVEQLNADNARLVVDLAAHLKSLGSDRVLDRLPDESRLNDYLAGMLEDPLLDATTRQGFENRIEELGERSRDIDATHVGIIREYLELNKAAIEEGLDSLREHHDAGDVSVNEASSGRLEAAQQRIAELSGKLDKVEATIQGQNDDAEALEIERLHVEISNKEAQVAGLEHKIEEINVALSRSELEVAMARNDVAIAKNNVLLAEGANEGVIDAIVDDHAEVFGQLDEWPQVAPTPGMPEHAEAPDSTE
jgi:hypothetical protein